MKVQISSILSSAVALTMKFQPPRPLKLVSPSSATGSQSHAQGTGCRSPAGDTQPTGSPRTVARLFRSPVQPAEIAKRLLVEEGHLTTFGGEEHVEVDGAPVLLGNAALLAQLNAYRARQTAVAQAMTQDLT